MNDDELYLLAAELGQQLLAAKLVVTTVESCTGGWVAKCLTDIPGSSAWFEQGLVTYSNTAKHVLVDVPSELLETHGAVSAEVVLAMAVGALENSSANVSVAISGVAGPDGGTVDKPVGMVYLAWAIHHGNDKRSRTRLEHFSGDREAVRRQAVTRALTGIQTLISSSV